MKLDLCENLGQGLQLEGEKEGNKSWHKENKKKKAY